MSTAQSVRGARRVASRAGGRAVPWIAAVALAGLAVAGCGTVPGAAVRIDGVSISTTTVLERTNEVVANNPQTATQTGAAAREADAVRRAQTSRVQVTGLIRHQLVLDAVADKGISVTDQDVNNFVAEYDQYRSGANAPELAAVLGVPTDAIHDTVYDLLVLDELIKKIPDDGADVTNVNVTVDVVPAPDWSTAVADRVTYLDDPAAMTRDAKAAQAANPSLPGGHESLLEQPHHAVFGIFSAREGEILLIPQGAQGYLVTRVTDRSEEPGKLTTAMIANTYRAAGLSGELALSSLLLGSYAQQADVMVNPRFGRWDPRIVQVVAGSKAQ